MSAWIADPATKEPMAALDGKPPRRPKSVASHWLIERENGIPVRMRWQFCDDTACCPTFEQLTGESA